MSAASCSCCSHRQSKSGQTTTYNSSTLFSTVINLQLIFCLTTQTILTTAIRGPPQVLSNYQKQQLVRSGDGLRLTCPVESDPQPIVEWQKDGETIHLGWSRFRLTADNALRIRDLEVDDTGIYVCKATNGFGNVDVLFQVYVYPAQGNITASPPKINFDEYFRDSIGPGEMPTFLRPEQMKDDQIVQMMGSTARLRCRATGRPSPEIVWYKDGAILPEELSSSAPPSEGSTGHWQLKLSDLSMNDAGQYTCKVFNKVGAINFTYTVQVIDPLSKPVIQDIQNTTIASGDTLVLQCQIYSEDQPKVEWLKRLDRPNHRGTEYNRTITMQNERYLLIHPGGVTISTKQNAYLNKLVVLDAKEEDGGMYLCSCATSTGFAFRSTFVSVLPGAVSNDRTEELDDAQEGYTYLPIVIAMTTVFGLVFLLGVIVFLHRRHADNQRKPKQTTAAAAAATEFPRAPTMTSSFTCHSPVDSSKHHDPHQTSAYAAAAFVQSSQGGSSSAQKHLLENNSYGPSTKNYIVYDSRSDNSSMLKTPIIQQHQQQQQQQQQQIHHHPLQHLHYPLL